MKMMHFIIDLGFCYHLYIIISLNNVLLTVTLKHSDTLSSWRFLHSPKKTENTSKEQKKGWSNYDIIDIQYEVSSVFCLLSKLYMHSCMAPISYIMFYLSLLLQAAAVFHPQ